MARGPPGEPFGSCTGATDGRAQPDDYRTAAFPRDPARPAVARRRGEPGRQADTKTPARGRRFTGERCGAAYFCL